jgi:hypothetical protein
MTNGPQQIALRAANNFQQDKFGNALLTLPLPLPDAFGGSTIASGSNFRKSLV